MKKCTHCTDTKNIKEISFAAAEAEAMRQQVTISRLIGVVALLVILLFGTNLAWIINEVII